MIIDDNVAGNGANDSVADPSPFFFLCCCVLAFLCLFFTIGPLYGFMSVGGSALSGRKAPEPRVWRNRLVMRTHGPLLAGPENNKSRSDFTTWLHYCCLIYFDLFLD